MASSSSFLRTSRGNLHHRHSQGEFLQPTLLRPIPDAHLSGSTSHARRSFSFFNDPPNTNANTNANANHGQQPHVGAPSYMVYGEEIAFALKAIPPEFRVLPSGTVILDASKRGRLLLEWTPMASGHDDETNSNKNKNNNSRRYRWDASTRFALTAEEAGSLLAKIDRGDSSVEFSRRISGDQMGGPVLDKVFIAKTIELEGGENDGISLLVDYVDPDNHQLGQVLHPPPGGGGGGGGGGAFGDEGMRGPLEIRLMVGEYQVLRSIIEHSIPRLVGWSTMFDRTIEQAIAKSVQGGSNQRGGGGGGTAGGSPHNYQGGTRRPHRKPKLPDPEHLY